MEDGLIECEHSAKRTKDLLYEHFGIKDKLEILDILYGKRFRKEYIASFAEPLSVCMFVFEREMINIF